MVYIRFSDDTDFNTPREEFDALFNPVEGISLKNFFNEASYGLLNIESHHYPVVTGQSFNYSFQDSHPRAYYQPYHAVTNPNGYQGGDNGWERTDREPVSYTHLRAHETVLDLVCRLLLEKKKHPYITHT